MVEGAHSERTDFSRVMTIRTADGRVFHVIQEEGVEHPPPPTIGVAYLGAILGVAIGGPSLGLLAVGGAVYAGSLDDVVGEHIRQLDLSILRQYAQIFRVRFNRSFPNTILKRVRYLTEITIATISNAIDGLNSRVPCYSDEQKVMGASAAVALMGSFMAGSFIGLFSAGLVVYDSMWENFCRSYTVYFGGKVLDAFNLFYYEIFPFHR